MDDDAEFEEQLRLITEESLRHYEQVELPRILSQRNADQAGPSRYFTEPEIDDSRISQTSEIPEEKKPNNNVEWEDMELEDDFEEVIQMQLDQADAKIPASTHPGLDTTLTTLERDEEAPGFHRDAGRTWVFPTDFPERRYQFDICQTAIFHDTLVCLPTGLGKTFIAAVVMYNMYRWYPQGCVIFLAPTRPLVNQQVTACRNVAGLPQEHTSELTGSINPNLRRELWRSRRVFFMTPQTLANDLATGIADPMRIRCVVLDEAHRARGSHAYCQLLNAIRLRNRNFRLLALSATPGANVGVIKEVLVALGVSRLEARAEDSKELAEFTHQRKIETIVLPLGSELLGFKQRIYTVVDEFSRTLRQRRLIQSGNLTKFGVLKASMAFRARNAGKDNVVESEFAVTLALCQAAELLCHHGLRAFHSNLSSLMTDPSRNRVSCRLRNSTTLTQLMDDVRASLGGDLAPQVDGALASYKCTHPKMQRLVQLVVEHLQRCHNENRSSRIIVFCQFRDVVTEIRHALEEHKPLVRPTHLIGQANASAANRGQTQKEQRQVLLAFNEGTFNVMIATCVGEEGLDIAEVDLIVCYEPHSSPIRLVQRMGRTGRKRDGRVVMLITEGRELQKYQQSVAQGGTISKQLLRPENFREALAKVEPPMLPAGLVPTVMRMTMNPRSVFAEPSVPAVRASKATSNQDLRVMLAKKAATKESIYASHQQMLAIGRPPTRLRATEFLHDKPVGKIIEWEDPGEWAELGRWIEWQRLEQDATVSPHSTLTQDLVQLLQFSSRQAKPGLVFSTLDVSLTTTSPPKQLTSQTQLASRQEPSEAGVQRSPLKELASQQGPTKRLRDDFRLASQPDVRREAVSDYSPGLASRQSPANEGRTKIKTATSDWATGHVCDKCRVLCVAAVRSRRPLQVRPVAVAADFPRGLFTYDGILEFTLKTLRSKKPDKKQGHHGSAVSVRENALDSGRWANVTADSNVSESAGLAAGSAKRPDMIRQSSSCVPRETDQSVTDFFNTMDHLLTSEIKKTNSLKKSTFRNQIASTLPPRKQDDLTSTLTCHKETTPKHTHQEPSTSASTKYLEEPIPVHTNRESAATLFANQTKSSPVFPTQKPSTSTTINSPVASKHSTINALKSNQSANDANQSLDMFEPWDLDVAAIDRACALREETLYSVEALIEQLARDHPYQNEGETRKAVTPVDELDLSDLLEGFNNPALGSGIARSTPLRGTGCQDVLPRANESTPLRGTRCQEVLPRANESTPIRGPHHKPSFKSPPSPIVELANESPSRLVNEIMPISLRQQSNLRLANDEPQINLRLTNEKPQRNLCPANNKPQSNLRLANDKPQSNLRLVNDKAQSNLRLTNEKPQSNLRLAPQSNLPLANDKPQSNLHLASKISPNKLLRANERTPSPSHRASDSRCLESSVTSIASVSPSSRDSNSDFESTPGFCRRRKPRRRERKQIAGRRRKCRFVESEAESSGRDSSDGENSSGLDAYDSSFVDDVSPMKGGGASQYVGLHASFSPLPSQPAANLAASYLEDSFVVQEAKESFAEPTELSPLSLAEQKLAMRRRRRRDDNATSSDEGKAKKRRRRIRTPSPDKSPANHNQRVFSQILQDFDWDQDFTQPTRAREGQN